MKCTVLVFAAIAGAQATLKHTINPIIQHSEYGNDYTPLVDVSKAIRGHGTTGIKNLKSKDLLCGPGGNVEAKEWANIPNEYYGLKINWESIWDKKTDQPTSFGKKFKGTYAAYIARPEDAHKPDGWLKISQWSYQKAGYWRDDLEKPVWGSDVAKTFKGDLFVPLTWEFTRGKYLVRLELIDFSDADQTFDKNPRKGATIYPLCLQINLTGPAPPPEWEFLYLEVGLKNRADIWQGKGLGFPGAYSYNTAGIKFDLEKDDPSSFKHPSGDAQIIGQGHALDFRVNPIKSFDLSIFRTLPSRLSRRAGDWRI